MLANGPACIRQGWPSSVWIRFGLSASFSSTAMAPAAPRSSAVTGSAAVVGVGDGDRAEPPAQVLQVARHREDRHHLGGGGDVEARLARVAVRAAALPEGDRAQGAVVHVERALPVDPQRVDLVRVAVQDRRVEQRGEQVVGGSDRVDVAGEVKVQVLHRDHLSEPAAGGAALDAEHRPERGLAQAQQRLLADRAEALGERRPRWWSSPRPALVGVTPATHTILASGASSMRSTTSSDDLGLVAAVGLELVGLEAHALGDRLDRQELGLLCDLKAALHRRRASSCLVGISGINGAPRRQAPKQACPRRSAPARTAGSGRAWRSVAASSASVLPTIGAALKP